MSSKLVDPEKFGVSFSLKQCRDFNIDPEKTLGFLLNSMKFRRFRLMSYWDEYEKTPGKYDFSALDKQIKQIEKAGGVITLCLGARQPRWPESHWPGWSLELPETERFKALYSFIEVVVRRYQNRSCVISWQLENEALNRNFGKNGDFNHIRLRTEFNLVRKLDGSRPIIMSTSNSWGIPLRHPVPDIVGFSYYTVQWQNKKGRYGREFHYAWIHKLRARLISLVWGRPSFIHELQAEPWGPKAIWEMPVSEQDKSMDVKQLGYNINLAKRTNLYPIDLWGSEWWYWRAQNNDDEIYQTVIQNITN